MIKRFLILFLLFGGALGALAWFKVRQMQQAAGMGHAQPPITIASAQVQAEQWQPALRSVGSLVAEKGIDLTVEVNGVISELHFDSGAQVEQGQLLLKLDDRVDRAALEAARAERKLAEIEFRRIEELLPKKAVSLADFDKAKAGYDAAAARVMQQEALVALKSLHTPFAGVLGMRRVDPGEYLSPGKVIADLQTLDPIFVDFSLPERHLSQLAKGMKVELTSDAYPGQTFTGEISAIAPGIAASTRTVQLRATLSNPEDRLRPGMFAEVRVLRPGSDAVLTIPRTAVSFNTYGDFVYVIEEGEGGPSVKRRQIQTGASDQGRIRVLKGLTAGEKLVRAGLVKLREGAKVQVDDSVPLDDAAASR